MPYNVNPQDTQDSITSYLHEKYPHIPIIPDGMIGEDDDDLIDKYQDQSIKPFIILWFNNPKRRPRGRSFASHKLDSRYASVDVVVVGRNGSEVRKLSNHITDTLLDFKPDKGGRLTEGSSLWGSTRSLDMGNRPSRFASTNRFDFGVSSTKVDT